MSKHTYPDGMDYVWIATDEDGHVGAFVTDGVGPIPVAVLQDSVLAIELVEEALHQLPCISKARLLFPLKQADDFVAIAERGIFVYDWRHVRRATGESTRAYVPIARPMTPIILHSLPTPAKELAARVKFIDEVFAEELPPDVVGQFECCWP
jgi:hypothetical protein